MKYYIKLYILTALFSVFLCAATHNAHAQFSGGAGTSGNPYLISTAEQLAELATLVNAGNSAYNDKHYQLVNDIDLTDYLQCHEWIPIGMFYNPFRGVFDGSDKVISNLYINRTTPTTGSRTEIGLFGRCEDATIKNIGVTNVNISATIFSTGIVGAGGLAGFILNGHLSRCYVTGSVSASSNGNAIAGGVAAEIGGSASMMEYCCFSGTVTAIDNNEDHNTGVNSHAGGVVGWVEGRMSYCYSSGSVTVSTSDHGNAGGVTGISYSAIVEFCYSTSAVSCNATRFNFAGGIVGNAYNTQLLNNAALIPVMSLTTSGNPDFGRIVGSFWGTLTNTNSIAFAGMINPDGNTSWGNIGATQKDGADISKSAIMADGTLGGRFMPSAGWTIEDGKLPGLFGQAVFMPKHLAPDFPVITTINLPNGTAETAYSQTIAATGITPVAWSLAGGSLPGGMALSSGGVISGMPATAGTYNFTVTAANSVDSDTKELSITVREAFVAVTNITADLPVEAVAGTPIALSGATTPVNATYQTIVWSVKSAGTTGATISGNFLNVVAAGTVVVTATIINGKAVCVDNTKDFTITIYESIVVVPFVQIVLMRWNNTLTVINNPAGNGGYNFVSYQWYRNGQPAGADQSWTAGDEGEKINPADRFYVEAITTDNRLIRTTESTITLKSASLKAFPNPVSIGQTLHLETDIDSDLMQGAVIEVYNMQGRLVETWRSASSLREIRIDGKYAPGTHIFVIKGKDGLKQEIKVSIEN